MKPPPEVYGDNFPVADGLSWDPRIPWRHRHAGPHRPAPWLRRIGWWTVVAGLMGLLMLLAAHDGFSAPAVSEAAGSSAQSGGTLVVQFREGAVRYPDGWRHALLHDVEFLPVSLQRLNACYGLIAMERVTSATRHLPHTFRLLFASPAGMTRAAAAYRGDPHVVFAARLGVGDRGSSSATRVVSPLRVLDA